MEPNLSPIRAARNKQSLKQIDLCFRTGLSLSTIRNAERGLATRVTLTTRGEMELPPPLLETSREGRMLDEVLHHLSAARQAVASYESVGKSLRRFECGGTR